MSEQHKKAYFVTFPKFYLSLPLTYSYNYISATPTEIFLDYKFFNREVYYQYDELEDWDELELGWLKKLYIDSIDDDDELALTYVLGQNSLTLLSFFTFQMVDIPHAFKKSKSLYSNSMRTPHLRLTTMLMRRGRKVYTSKLYSSAIHSLAQNFTTYAEDDSSYAEWRLQYNIFSTCSISLTRTSAPSLVFNRKFPALEVTDKFRQINRSRQVETSTDYWVYGLIQEELLSYLPIFSFYIRKVDKLKRKHSRGKSGKYSIVWKYVPKYKRFITVLRWLVRDIRFQKFRTFGERLLRSLETFVLDPHSHLISKLRSFVHVFVFQHHKKTLLKTLRSVA